MTEPDTDPTQTESNTSGTRQQPAHSEASDGLTAITGTETETRGDTERQGGRSGRRGSRADASHATGETLLSPPDWLTLEGDERVLWRGSPCWRSLLSDARFLAGLTVGVLALVLQLSSVIPVSTTLVTPELNYRFLVWPIHIATTSATIPLFWIPLAMGGLAGILLMGGISRPLFSSYVLTDHRICINTSVRSADHRAIALDRLAGVRVRHILLASLLSYGDLVMELTGEKRRRDIVRGIANPRVLSQLIYDLEADPRTSVDLRPERIQVSPARDVPDPHEVVEELGSLHPVFTPEMRLRDRLFRMGRSEERPAITFDIFSRGKNQPVEFFYGAHRHLDALEQRLRKALPNSFDIERVKCDLEKLLVPPRVYSPAEFKDALARDAVQCAPEEVAALHSYSYGAHAQSQPQSPSQPQSQSESTGPHVEADGGSSLTRGSGGSTSPGDASVGSQPHIDPTDDSVVLSLPEADIDAEIDVDSVLFRQNGTLSSSERVALQEVETPAMTPEGNILARAAATETSPLGVEWSAKGDRMMPLEPFSEVVTSRDDHAPAAHPLSTIIDDLATAGHPSALHVAVEAEDDWSDEAQSRQKQLRNGGGGTGVSTGLRVLRGILLALIEGLLWLIEGLFEALLGGQMENQQPRPREERPQKRRDVNDELPGEDSKINRIAQKQPHRTYLLNASWMSVPSTDGDASTDPGTVAPELDNRLETLTSVFNRISSTDYGLRGSRIRTGHRKKTKTKRARRAFARVFDREVTRGSTGSWFSRRGHVDVRVNSEGLANFAAVPGANSLTATGIRGTRSEQDSRKSLSPPHRDHLEQFHSTRGLDLGHIMDDDGTKLPEVASLSPQVLTSHYARLVSTDGGKTVALTNDALSLYENTDGPVVVVDTRGGNLVTNYMRSHAARFGFEDLEENVLHFSIPDIMPGFSFFDIRPALENGRSRIDAIADKTDNYQEILALAMGSEYSDANVAPILIPSLLKTLYDEEYGFENGRYRESLDYFAHDQFEHVIDQLRRAGPPEPDPAAAPQSNARNVTRVIQRQLERDKRSFEMVMGGVNTRTHYISGDDRLQPMFNNTDSRFEFRDMLDENKVILLDLSGLRKASARVVAGVLLTQLFDALRENQETVAAKPPEYLVNVLVDEAASVIGSATVNTMLEEGRKFRLSLGLATQFPEQFKYEADRQAYLNVLNNVATPIVGQINIDEKIAETLAYDELSVEAVQNRLKYLPRGELMVRTRSKGWGENHPTPFTLSPMPIPTGHPDGDAPLSDAEEQQFQEALARVDERTYREYGVHADHTPPGYLTPGELQAYLGGESSAFDDVLIEVVRTVQLHEEVVEENGWVTLQAVEDELTNLFTAVEGLDAETDGPAAEELDAIEQRSHLLELSVDDGVDVIRLTEKGIENAALDLGHVEAAGGADHVGLLEAVEQELSKEGFSVTLVKQDGRELPDARAFHPDIDETYHIEAEHTTPEVPIKVFDNLWKAQNTGCTPIFVVETDPDMPTYWAKRIEHILSPPVKHAYEDGRIEYYTYDEEVELAGGKTAVRPTNGPNDSRYSVWTGTADGQYVLRDSNRTEYARITDWEELTKQDFLGSTWYDPDSNQHVVFAEGTEHRYDSWEALAEDWVTVKKPYLPEMELIEPEYTRDDYEIVMLPLGEDEHPEDNQHQDAELPDEPLVYRNETTHHLSVLVEGVPDEDYSKENDCNSEQLQDKYDTGNTLDQSPSTDADMPEPSIDPYRQFFDYCVTDSADEVANEEWIGRDETPLVPKDDLKKALEIWLDSHNDDDSPSVTKTALTQTILPEYTDGFSTGRSVIKGHQTTSYVGFSLTNRGIELLDDM